MQTIVPNKIVQIVSTWSMQRMVSTIVVSSVLTSMTASVVFALLLQEPITLILLLRAFFIPLAIAVFMTSIWMQFVKYLRQTQAALRASEAKNHAILQALPDLMFHLSRDGCFLDYHAPRVEDLLRPPEAFLGQSVHDIFPKKIADQVAVHIECALNTGRVELLEYETSREGDVRFNEARFAMLDEDTVLAIVRDITARKHAEAALVAERASLAQRVEERTVTLRETNNQLVAALRTRDEFLAIVSHELRTPLTAILAFADLMRRQIYGPLNTRQQQALSDIRSSGNHLLAVINDVLDFSRIETGQLMLDVERLDVKTLCQDSLKLVEHTVRHKEIQLFTDFDESVSIIQADERRMRQMLVNLLDNAIKFTPTGGSIGLEVRGDVDTGTAQFTVWDTGIGIPSTDVERIFQPFVQLDSSISRQYEGTGLGLALVYYLVEMHGGSVSVTSEIGQGSRFTLTLPWKLSNDVFLTETVDSPGTVYLPSGSPAATQDRPLILVAEDNRLNCKMLCDLLVSEGYRVITAQDGTMAVYAAREHHPNLILMDIQMPGVDGLEAMRLIKADVKLRDIPIIVVTALAMPGDRDRCVAAGATDYLSKPIDTARLLAATWKALAQNTG